MTEGVIHATVQERVMVPQLKEEGGAAAALRGLVRVKDVLVVDAQLDRLVPLRVARTLLDLARGRS